MKENLLASAQVKEFLSRAQVKIGELGTLLMQDDYTGDTFPLELLIEYLECLDDEHNPWTLEEVLADIELFNQRFDLNTIPYVEILPQEIYVLAGAAGGRLGSSYDIADFAQRTKQLIRSTAHNELQHMQGGQAGQRYHVDKEEYDLIQFLKENKAQLMQLLYLAPTAKLAILNSVPDAIAGVYERGVAITQLQLTPTVQVNGGKKLLRVIFYQGAVEIQRQEGENPGAPYVHKAVINASTAFKIIATFENGESVQDSKNTIFVKPYFYTSAGKNKTPDALNLVKVIKPDASQLDVAYVFAAGNAGLSNPDPQVPYFMVPKSKGLVKKILGDNNPMADYITGFKVTEVQHVYPDNTQEAYYLYEKLVPVDGNMTFNFIW